MKKRLLTFLLSFVMLAGIVSVSTVDADAATTDEILAENVTGNTYTDTTAKAEESYIYTIERSDGAVQEIVVLAEGTETGNSVQSETTTSGGIEYVLANKLTSGETYVIVDEKNNALKSDGTIVSSQRVEVIDDTITGPLPDLEWTISHSENYKYSFKDDEGKYLLLTNTESLLSTLPETVICSTSIIYEHYYGFYLRNSSWYKLYLNEEDNSASSSYYYYSTFKLYAKAESDTGGTVTTYTIDTTGLDALIAECEQLLEKNYTVESWADFETALIAAKNAKSSLAESYVTEEAANAALAGIDAAHNALLFAKNALEQLDPFTAEFIKWERTLEPANESANTIGDLVVGAEYITNAEPKTDENGSTIVDTNYSVITWRERAEDILALTTDPTMTVWDYNTDNQYSVAGKVDNVVAATWNEHEQPNTGVDGWRNASVRRFTGNFIWPEGYDVDDRIIFQSVNDSNYQSIYNYINNNPELKARYGDSKVYPINDDMFIFIRKASDVLATENFDYLNHMLFWTGTSGKGLWSAVDDMGGGDWDRTAPATFNGISALPAYYSVMPNNNDISGTPATVDDLAIDEMKHSDGWYTMVDADTIMTTVRNLYGVENLEGQEMIIDVFCFDNSGSGGMDKFDLIFQKTPETTTSVQVNYYLDSIMADNLLGSTVMTGVADGTQITLHKGTDVNELDRFRFAAADKAGSVVSVGVQQSPVPYIVDITQENNIINVVYTSGNADDRVYYFYDFGVENEYIYTPKPEAVLDGDYEITAVENTNPNIRVSIAENKKDVVVKYAPSHARGEVAVGILNIVFDDAYGTVVKPIVISPATNVLFEENFMKQSTETELADWTTTSVKIECVKDNERSFFGYTDSYAESIGHSGVKMATVNSANVYTDTLQFEFGGTGFDLIGTCGPNTGTIAVRVVNSAGKAVKNYLVDTSYTDTTNVVSNGTTLYQVPLLQTKSLPEDTYTVTICGAYIIYGGGASTYSRDAYSGVGGNDPVADIYELCYGVGMTEEDIESLEFINMGKLMGASTYALAGGTDTTSVEIPAEMLVAIDGFRSYRTSAYDKYPEMELGAIYLNILDCVGSEFAAYIETKADGTYNVNNYELSGGPQNEIYLTSANAHEDSNTKETTGLVLGEVNSPYVHLSLRSVDGNEVVVKINGGDSDSNHNGSTITLKHTTEMYYPVYRDDDGFITVQVVKGFLGIGNLKLASGYAVEPAAAPTALTEEDYALAAIAMRKYAAISEGLEEVIRNDVLLEDGSPERALLEDEVTEEVVAGGTVSGNGIPKEEIQGKDNGGEE